MYEKLFSHTLIYGLSPYVSKILGLLILPIITKDLTELDYGVYGIILAYVGAIEVLKDLGLNLTLYNSFTQMPQQHKWLWRSIYGFLSFWNILYAALAGVLIYFIVPEEAMENRFSIILLSVLPIVIFGPTALIGRVFYQMREMPMQIAWRTAVFGIVSILLSLYTISYLKMGYMGWFWSYFISGLLTNLSFWIPINLKYKLTPLFNFKRRLLKDNLKISIPTVPHYYSNYITQSSDKMILDVMQVNTADIGGYNFAGTFGGYFAQLGNALGQAARPIFNTEYKLKNYKKVREVIYLMQVGFFAFTFFTCLWLKEIFQLLVRNENMAATYPMAVILIMAMNYRPMYFGSAGPILYMGKTKKLLLITFIGALLSVLINFSLIPFFGVWPAVFSTFISMMYIGYSGYFLKEFKETKTNFYPLYWLAATIILTITAFFAVELALIYKLLLSFLLVFVIIFALYKFCKHMKNG